MNRPITSDQDAIRRMRAHAARLKELDCRRLTDDAAVEFTVHRSPFTTTTRGTTMPVTLATAVAPIQTPGQCYVRALRLGFTFPQVDGGRVAIGPPQVTPSEKGELEAVRAYLQTHEAKVLAHADPAPGLRSASAAPRKIGTDLFGRPLPAPAPAEPEPPPFVAPPTRGLPPVSSLSPAEVTQECRAIATEYDVLSARLAALPEEVEDEPRETQAERQRLWARVAFLQRRAQALEERRQAEMWSHVDQCERSRRLAADGGPRLIAPGWRLRPRRSA